MYSRLFTVEEVIAMINAGKKLVLAGEEGLLSQLPDGDWIGGTTVFFMTADGGCTNDKMIYVTELPDYVKNAKRVRYNTDTIDQIYVDAYDHGYTMFITPTRADVTTKFSLECLSFKDFALKPLAGWVAAVALDKLTTKRTAVFNGNGTAIYDDAVAFHIELPANKLAEVHAINLLKQSDMEDIEFLDNGYDADEVLINGQKASLFDYFISKGVKGLPLIANYSGTMINITPIPSAIPHHISFAGPFFKGVKYRLAQNPGDYVEEFAKMAESYQSNGEVVFSCNCMMNYLLGQLEGRRVAGFSGPFTGGEICYQLVNQTISTIDIIDI